MTKIKILIIGSKGFIGSNIYLYYSKLSNISVFGCDIYPIADDTEKYFYIDKNNPNYEIIFKNHQFDVCINASGLGNVSLSFLEPHNDFLLNSANVVKILDAIRVHNNNCKFVNFSSAAVYGNPISLPVKESDLIKPLSPYGFHKSVTEKLCAEYSSFFNIRTCNLRVFSAYGPGLKKQLFWDIYQKSKLYGDIIELFGTGNETRDFIYINDLCEAIHCIINNAIFEGECINVASGTEITIDTASKYICENLAPNKKIVFNGEIKQGDPLNWRADISSLSSFGFSPVVSIKEGLLNYSKWIIENQL